MTENTTTKAGERTHLTQSDLIDILKPLVRDSDLSTVTLALARVADEEAEYENEIHPGSLSAQRWGHAARLLNDSTRNMAV